MTTKCGRGASAAAIAANPARMPCSRLRDDSACRVRAGCTARAPAEHVRAPTRTFEPYAPTSSAAVSVVRWPSAQTGQPASTAAAAAAARTSPTIGAAAEGADCVTSTHGHCGAPPPGGGPRGPSVSRAEHAPAAASAATAPATARGRLYAITTYTCDPTSGAGTPPVPAHCASSAGATNATHTPTDARQSDIMAASRDCRRVT